MFKRKKVTGGELSSDAFTQRVRIALNEIDREKRQQKFADEHNKEERKKAEKEFEEIEKEILDQFCPVLKKKCRRDCQSYEPPEIHGSHNHTVYDKGFEIRHAYGYSIRCGGCQNDTVIRSRTNR